MKRRRFFEAAGWLSAAVAGGWRFVQGSDRRASGTRTPLAGEPLVISTWRVQEANEAAWQRLAAGDSAMDAVEMGVRVEEADEKGQSVGIGGLPDREGQVTLDACVMDHRGEAGAVVYVQGIKHVVSLARRVMEKTPHVILAGAGAEQFAKAVGFEEEDLLTESAKKAWKAWLVEKKYEPVINAEMHDTIGMLALDNEGRLSGACSTSGLAYKMNGRVGDSPIIGAGLFVDNEVGAATATGVGESILKVAGSALIVERMRLGDSPQQACKEAIRRIARQAGSEDFQACFIAVNRAGDVGAYALQPGFVYTITRDGKHEVLPAESHYSR